LVERFLRINVDILINKLSMTGKRKRVKADEGKQFVLSSSHHSVDE